MFSIKNNSTGQITILQGERLLGAVHRNRKRQSIAKANRKLLGGVRAILTDKQRRREMITKRLCEPSGQVKCPSLQTSLWDPRTPRHSSNRKNRMSEINCKHVNPEETQLQTRKPRYSSFSNLNAPRLSKHKIQWPRELANICKIKSTRIRVLMIFA